MARCITGASAVLLAGMTASAAVSQPAAGTAAEDPARKSWVEIERGFYVSGTGGASILLNAPGDRSAIGLGLSVGLAVGVDIGDAIQVEGYFTGAQISAPADYVGLGEPSAAAGDFSAVSGGLLVRFALVRFADTEGLARLFLNVQAGGGVTFSEPQSVFAGFLPTVVGGFGLRYFTRLRHFSLGFDVDASLGLGPNSIVLYPHGSLTYTF